MQIEGGDNKRQEITNRSNQVVPLRVSSLTVKYGDSWHQRETRSWQCGSLHRVKQWFIDIFIFMIVFLLYTVIYKMLLFIAG